MNQIVRTWNRAALAATTALFLAPASLPALAQTPQNVTCQPSTVTVSPTPTGGNLQVTCTSPGTGGTGPTCSITINPLSPPLTAAGGGVQVTANNCGTITSWMGAVSTAARSAVVGPPVPATFADTLLANTGTSGVTYSYSVTGSTGSNGNSIVVPAPAPSGGGTSCGTPVIMAWSAGGYSRTNVPVASGSMAMAQFTVATSTTINGTPKIILSNSGGSNRATWALASSPCTFPTPTDPLIGGPGVFTGGLEYFSLTGTPASYQPVLKAGGTYYINIKDAGSGTIFVDLYN